MTLSSYLVSFVIITIAVILGDILCADTIGNQRNSQNPWQLGNTKGHALSNGPQLGPNSASTTAWPALGRQTNRQNGSPTAATNQPMWVRPNNGTIWVRNTPQNQNVVNPNNRTPVNQNNGLAANRPGNQIIGMTGNQNNDLTLSRPVANQNNGMTVSSPVNHNANNRNNGVSINRPINQNTLFLNNERGGLNSNGGGMVQNRPGTALPLQGAGNNLAASNSNPPRSQSNNNNNNRVGGVISPGSMVGNNRENVDDRRNGAAGNQQNEVTDDELRDFAEVLLSKDINNAARHVTLNLQGMTTSRSMVDQAPQPLLTISQDAYSIPSISKLILLYNNYILEVNQNEVYTAQEKAEENDLLDTILSTPVMQHARNFLIEKGKLGRDPKDFKDLLRLIWFNMYSRGGGRIGSSGFEHIFLAELKNSQVSGLHNWVYFREEEKKNNANYLGYLKKLDLGNKGAIVKYHFTFHDVDKPVGSMFVGTSPELEMALYSTCFVLRADRICPLKMNGNRFIIRTYSYRYRGKNMIGSAFPEI
ncbi:hypothetical protein JTB14_031659 [Gonioctena quinquepunctata]|nr:hypothetical protein JTB14_031659 [Gonioctena quinquepunctata]